jgi:hypothetical protein
MRCVDSPCFETHFRPTATHVSLTSSSYEYHYVHTHAGPDIASPPATAGGLLHVVESRSRHLPSRD